MDTELYLNLVKRGVMGFLDAANDVLDLEKRLDGDGPYPPTAHTMIGRRRLDHVQAMTETVLRENIAGDLVECGVWRGGTTIFMRALLQAYGITDRSVWVVDSFQGLHPPDYTAYPDEQHPRVKLWEQDWLRISAAEVKHNFERYGLLDQQVRFLEGWVEQTVPVAPIDQIAVLRIDVDMYEPTMICLEHLYPKLAVGGFVDLDDYPVLSSAVKAVDHYRERMGIENQLIQLEGYTGAYWRKQ